MTSTDLMNVSAFENQAPDAAFATLNPQSESLADGIGQSYGVVAYKGKVWTLRKAGETHTFVRADDGSPSAFLDVVVLRSAAFRSKSWYEGGYTEGVSGVRPTCASINGVNPDLDAMKPQAQACALCPRNEFKTNAQGRKGKECADYKRLAVLILPYQFKSMGIEPIMEPVFLRIPAASLNDLAVLGEGMTKKGFHYSTYVTRIGFVVDKPHPQMTFRALQKLTEKEAPLVLGLREDPQAIRITGEHETAQNALSPRTQGVNIQQAVQQVSKPVIAAPARQPAPVRTEEDEITKLRRQLAEAEAKTKTTATSHAPITGNAVAGNGADQAAVSGFGLEQVEFGLGEAQSMVEVAPSAPGPAAAVTKAKAEADIPPADESDADLDARLARLLPR